MYSVVVCPHLKKITDEGRLTKRMKRTEVDGSRRSRQEKRMVGKITLLVGLRIQNFMRMKSELGIGVTGK